MLTKNIKQSRKKTIFSLSDDISYELLSQCCRIRKLDNNNIHDNRYITFDENHKYILLYDLKDGFDNNHLNIYSNNQKETISLYEMINSEIINDHITCPISFEEIQVDECIVATCCWQCFSYDIFQKIKGNNCPLCRRELTTQYITIYDSSYNLLNTKILKIGISDLWNNEQLINHINKILESKNIEYRIISVINYSKLSGYFLKIMNKKYLEKDDYIKNFLNYSSKIYYINITFSFKDDKNKYIYICDCCWKEFDSIYSYPCRYCHQIYYCIDCIEKFNIECFCLKYKK